MNTSDGGKPPLTQRVGDTARRTIRRLRAIATDDQMEVTIDSTTALFQVKTSIEYKRYANVTDEFREHTRQLLSCLQKKDVFWDVGACTGRYACLAAQVGAQVVAVEPNTHQHARLAENLELNDATPDIYPYALGSEAGRMPLEGRDVVGAAARLSTNPRTSHVAIERGDRLVSDGIIPKPDVVKLDIDGAEIGALEGLEGALTGCHDVFLDVHEQHGVEWSEIERLLEAGGFEIETIGERVVGGNTKIHGYQPN